MTTQRPSADVSVRVAWADDAQAIAEVQVTAWRAAYAGLLPAAELDALEAARLAAGWHASLVQPRDARNRVLVALDRNRIVGFAVLSPAADPDCDPVADGELADLTVLPAERGRGHGSRLQQAAVETLAADRFTRAVTWVATGQDDLRAWLAAAGWAPDGAHRALDLYGDGAVTVKQVRLHTALA